MLTCGTSYNITSYNKSLQPLPIAKLSASVLKQQQTCTAAILKSAQDPARAQAYSASPLYWLTLQACTSQPTEYKPLRQRMITSTQPLATRSWLISPAFPCWSLAGQQFFLLSPVTLACHPRLSSGHSTAAFFSSSLAEMAMALPILNGQGLNKLNG